MSILLQHWSRLWQQSWTFRLSGLGWLLPFQLIEGIKISLGVWFRVSKDNVLDRSTTVGEATNHEPVDADHIRVLTLHPGNFNDQLEGILTLRPLYTTDASYETLSYCWGPADDVGETIRTNYTPALPIRINLANALRYLRSATEPRYLWIDAICIDHSNIEEVNQQVSVMAHVYRMASAVNIWLGLETENSRIGLGILSFLAGTDDIRSNSPWSSTAPELLRSGLEDIMHRDWFHRIWMIQELVMSSRLRMIVGSQSFEWLAVDTHRFYLRLKFAVISPQWEDAGLGEVDTSPFLDMIELAYVKMNGYRPTITLLDVLHNMRYRKATDRRDMIFALINVGIDVPEDIVNYKGNVEDAYDRLYKHVEAGMQGIN